MMIVKKITNCYSDMHFRMVQHNVFFRSQKCLSHKQIGLLSGINNINFEVPFFMSIPSPSCGSPSPGMSFRKDPGHSSATLYLLPL